MTRASWKGALEVAGFPVNVELHNRVKSRSADSFKTLGTDNKPIHQVLIEESQYERLQKAIAEGQSLPAVETIGRNDTSKGVPYGDGYQPLPKEAVEAITASEKSTMVGPKCFVPVDSLPLDLADKSFAVVPDKKVPGADTSANLIWNGLREHKLAYTTEITMRAGSPDAILAVYADDDGLWAITLPYAEQLNVTPTHEFTVDGKSADVFGKFVSEQYETHSFDHAEYASQYRERRNATIEAALEGKDIEVPEPVAPTPGAPDLMAIMENAVSGTAETQAEVEKATQIAEAAAEVNAR